MGAWSIYFLAKIALYYKGAIGLHWFENFALAVALAWPISNPRLRRLRHLLAIAPALVLLYHDSYLPPWTRTLDQLGALGGFRPDYLLELARRAVPMAALLALAAMGIVYWLLAHRIRFATGAFLALLAAAVFPPRPAEPAPPDPSLFARAGEASSAASAAPADLGAHPGNVQLDAALAAALARDQGKIVSFSRAGTPRFDLILLSVCSLSDDDLDVVHMRDAPLLARFDVVFRQFNSAATYSGPAVLRLLHGTCGPTSQADLYSGTAPDDCYLLRNLAAAGYRPAMLLNHDGRFDNFGEQMRTRGGLATDPDDNRYAAVAMTAFDGTPVRDDFDVLAPWWRAHARADAQDGAHFALVYNTITLHDGNRAPGLGGNSLESYPPRLRRFFSDLDRFIDLVEASGRPTVVVLIPEHGAALRGDALQISGLRELPTPAITRVPAAVKLIGFGPALRGRGGPRTIDQPVSYLALTTLIGGLIQSGPEGTTPGSLQSLLSELPTTEWVAENAGMVLLRHADRSYLRTPNGQWTELSTP
jgi:cellulose synthase operon protein YhjU